jgi:hypothetical protein
MLDCRTCPFHQWSEMPTGTPQSTVGHRHVHALGGGIPRPLSGDRLVLGRRRRRLDVADRQDAIPILAGQPEGIAVVATSLKPHRAPPQAGGSHHLRRVGLHEPDMHGGAASRVLDYPREQGNPLPIFPSDTFTFSRAQTAAA